MSAHQPEIAVPEITSTGLPPAFPDRAAWGTARQLRAWQRAALEEYFATQPRDFLAVATPWPVGMGVLAAWTVASWVVGAALLQRRDV